ncbi:MAG: ribonuclease PH [Planctomycetota bacterium]|nr:MAG: ribonuclease PH [Planctomycetota bacterium]
MRELRFEPGFLDHPDGSCLVCYGKTRVLCTAVVEQGVPRWLGEGAGGWVTAEYSMLPGSVGQGRKKRERGKPDGRSVEIQRLIGRSLRAAVRLDLLGPRTVTCDCDVLQADGGTRTAAISGAWVALHGALARVAAEAGLAGPGELLRGPLAAVSVGIVDGEVVCDLDHAADARAEVDMNVVMLGEEFVEIQGTGEKGTFTSAQLDALLAAARQGIRAIREAQRAALEG